MTRQELKDSGNWIIVLDDGKTFSGMDGSSFALLTDDQRARAALGQDVLAEVQMISLDNLLDWAIDNGYMDAFQPVESPLNGHQWKTE
jgi:hypothetical protein